MILSVFVCVEITRRGPREHPRRGDRWRRGRGERIDASVVLWCAGVKATPIAAWLGTPTTRTGAIKVAPDLSVPGVSNIFVIGDVAAVDNHGGKSLPLVAPVAKQEGAYVARVIRGRLDGKAPPSAFGYRDPGSLAIIGRSAAAVDFGFVQITGFAGWLVWGFAHIFFLIGFRSRIAVFLEWAWEWLTYARGARLIIGPAGARRDGEARPSPSSPVVSSREAAPPTYPDFLLSSSQKSAGFRSAGAANDDPDDRRARVSIFFGMRAHLQNGLNEKPEIAGQSGKTGN